MVALATVQPSLTSPPGMRAFASTGRGLALASNPSDAPQSCPGVSRELEQIADRYNSPLVREVLRVVQGGAGTLETRAGSGIQALAAMALSHEGRLFIAQLAERRVALTPLLETSCNFDSASHEAVVPLRMVKNRTARDLSRDWAAAELAIWLAGQMATDAGRGTVEILHQLASATRERVLTYNVWGLSRALGFGSLGTWRFAEIGKRIAALPHEVVALQEMWHPRTEAALNDLAARSIVRSRSIHGWPWSRGLVRSSGLATAVKGTVRESETLHFRRKSGIERVILKSALRSRVEYQDGRVRDIINLHAASPPEGVNNFFTNGGRAEIARIAQFAELSAWLESVKDPAIPMLVMGDLNSPQGSSAYSAFERMGGVDLHRARYPVPSSDSERARTLHNGHTMDPTTNLWAQGKIPSPERLDQCWMHHFSDTRTAVGCSRLFHTPSDTLSDHYAASFEIVRW